MNHARRRAETIAGQTARSAAIVALGCLVLFPMYWMVVISLTPTG